MQNMETINLIQQIESIRTELSNTIEAGGELDQIYNESFEKGKNQICDDLVEKVQSGQIDQNNLQTYVAELQNEISDLIAQRREIEDDCTANGVRQRAYVNSRIDAMSSFSSYLSTLLSEIARERYNN